MLGPMVKVVTTTVSEARTENDLRAQGQLRNELSPEVELTTSSFLGWTLRIAVSRPGPRFSLRIPCRFNPHRFMRSLM